ncbi:MAG: hypothetical protein ABIP48_22105, partial [Planctomycetota bacterium]
MRHAVRALGFSTLLLVVLTHARADHVLLLVDNAPADGLVVSTADLTGAARWCKLDAVAPEGIRAVAVVDGREVPFHFVPAADYDPRERIAGTVIVQLPETSDGRLRLEFTSAEKPRAEPWDGTVATPAYVVKHDAKKLGGLPSTITFPKTG